jgi:hypothetical protein
MVRTTRCTLLALALVAGVFAAGPGEAQSIGRSIHVNGQRMNPAQIALLDGINCGTAVPSGRYWVNWATRAWGHEGGPRQGWLPDCRRAAQAQAPAQAPSSKRYIEDRVFERYGVDMIHMPVYR